MEEIDKVLAVIVLYNTHLRDSISFKTLTESLNVINKKMGLIVYDNSIGKQNISAYKEWDVTYIHNAQNPGVGKAYNEGNKIALEENKKWMLLLDQDTVFPINAISIISNNLENNIGIKLFAPILKNGDIFISPSDYKFKRGFAPKNIVPGISELKGKSPINSGLIISTNLYSSIGGYNEKIKLDFSDFNFISKLNEKITQFCVMDLICAHNLSTMSSPHKLTKGILYRYQTYCEGAKFSIESNKDYIIYFMITLLRGVKMSIVYKTTKFIPIFYRSFLINND